MVGEPDGPKPALVEVLPPTEPDRTFGVASLNLMLPNGAGGWWIRKMYRPEVPEEQRAWPHRRRRFAELLLGLGADLICLQEASPASFEDDLRFLAEAGYDGIRHQKAALCPATFWRRDRFVLREAQHLDRVLLTALDTRSGARAVHLLNVHLTAGPFPDRRLRQVHEGLERIRKRIEREGGDPAEARALVCGDFNGYGPTAVRRLLAGGEVGPEFAEPRAPGPLTSRIRRSPFGPLRDVYAEAWRPDPPPPTLIVPRLDWMVGPDGGPSPELLEGLGRLHASFGPEPWDRATVDRWLTAINGAPDRGSEHDEVLRIYADTGEERLSRDQLIGIYLRSLAEGKFWTVDHDLRLCGFPCPPPSRPPIGLCLDQLWCSTRLRALAVRPPWTRGQRQAILEEGLVLPSGDHPSDHLPLGAVFAWG